MPLLRLSLAGPLPENNPVPALQAGLTQLMAGTLGKRAELTVVQVHTEDAAAWARDGKPVEGNGWAASLEVFISADTNTPDEVAAFMDQAHALIRSRWTQPPAAPLYILVHAVDGASWGYDGRSQAARRQAKAPV